ncbi:MAG TPA: HAD family hydrolase [Candidatus Melainabacteria bacterium]|nr:HAD family hydrolase [Candidatus Melainabacteria bacterium]
MKKSVTLLILLLTVYLSGASSAIAASEDAKVLASWKEGPSRNAIVDFVKTVTDSKSKCFIPVHKRIAVFDNDGTLWCEKPVYPQFIFAIDRVKAVIEERPELKEEAVFQAALKGDHDSLAKSGAEGIQRLIGATHGGMTAASFESIVSDWMKSARHPRFKQPYNKCVYKPMLELLDYLRAHGFRTFIVSGGGRDFMRPWTKETYGVDAEEVVGSSCHLEYRDGDVYRTEKIDFLNDGKEKPVGICRQIGMRPVAAFGNSDGDFEMLEWTKSGAGKGKSLCMLVHHTDAKREYAYDRDSKVGHLERGLDHAAEAGWVIVDMQKDWSRIFSFEE